MAQPSRGSRGHVFGVCHPSAECGGLLEVSWLRPQRSCGCSEEGRAPACQSACSGRRPQQSTRTACLPRGSPRCRKMGVSIAAALARPQCRAARKGVESTGPAIARALHAPPASPPRDVGELPRDGPSGGLRKQGRSRRAAGAAAAPHRRMLSSLPAWGVDRYFCTAWPVDGSAV